MSRQDGRLPLWAKYVDVAALVLLAVGSHVALTGGFLFRVIGFKVSIRSPWRSVAAGVALLAIRHLVVSRPAISVQIATFLRNIARAIRRLPDDRHLLGIEHVPRPRTRARAVLTAIAVLVLFSGLTVIMTYPQARHLHTVPSRETGDALLSTWRLSWSAHQLVRDPWHLFDANIFHPARYTLAFSDATVVPALTVAPLIWSGVHQLVAYNLLLLSCFVLSGFGMFVLVRSLTGQITAALLASFIFAFLPYRFMHYAHLELQMTQWMPLCLWALHRTVNSGRLRDGLLAGAFFGLQALSCMYYGIFFATFLVPLVGVLLAAGGRAPLIRSIRALGAGALLAGVLIAPIALPYLAARRSVGERSLREIQIYSATPKNYLAADPSVPLGERTSRWGQQERYLFQGVVVPLIAVVGLWPPLSAVRLGYGVAMLLALDASLGLNGVSYPWLHALVVPYRGLRVPARMAVLVGLSLSVLVGYGVARVNARRPVWVACGISLVVALLIFVEYRSRIELRPVWTSAPPVYERLRNEPSSVLLELPIRTPDIYLEPVYMYFSTFHWHRLVNGYSGFSPPSYAQLLGLMGTFPRKASVAELRQRDVRFVIVHGALFDQPDDYEQTIADIGRVGDFELVGIDPWEGKETRLYRLLPVHESTSSLPGR